MNVIDLELYRWKLHRMGAFSVVSKPILKHRSWGLSTLVHNVEYKTFISMLPRQSGKTEILIRMAKILQEERENFIIVVPMEAMKKNILQRFPTDPAKIEVVITATLAFNFSKMPEGGFSETNLLIDEYNFLHKSALKNLLAMDWKSISMVGGLKI